MNINELKIFPCLPNKAPATAGGLYDAAPPFVWTEEAPLWGAPTGEINGFFVVDVDNKPNEGKDGLATMARFDWGNTEPVETPSGGKHIYYKYDATKLGSIGNKVNFLPGIDLRTNGGYVVLYSEQIPKLIDPPEWLIEVLKSSTKKKKEKISMEGEVGEGGRNHYITSAAGRLQRLGVLTLTSLHEINQEKCSPPLEDEEVELIYNSIQRYEPDSTPDEEEVPAEVYDTASSLIGDFISYLSDDKQKFGEPLGIEGLDELLGGGIRPGELVGILAQAKSGKSSLTHKIIHTWLKGGIPTGYASRELRPATEVMPNLVSIELKKNVLKEPITQEEAQKVVEKWPLYFSKGFGFMSLEEMREWCLKLKEKGVTRFVFDHLHHFCGDEDYKVIALFSRSIKQLMIDLNVSGILVIQPKQINDDQRISFNMIRGGSAVGQAIDALITLERQRDGEGKLTSVTKVKLDIARHKLAKLGEIYLNYDKETMDYTEVEWVEEPKESQYSSEQELEKPAMDYGRSRFSFNQKRIGS